MDYTKLTIKHFIYDLPRIFNNNFETITKLFNRFLVEENENTITLKTSPTMILKGEFTSISANTIRATNLQILGSDNKYVSLDEYIEEKVRETVSSMISE